MKIALTRALLAISSFVLLGTGCAATPSDAEEQAQQEPEENVGTAQQATIYLDNCADGNDVNERFSLGGPGSDASYSRSSGYVNPGGVCGPDARRVTIVQFDVNGGIVYPYKFTVWPSGSYTVAQCSGMEMHVRVERKNKTTGIWETVYWKQGSDSTQDNYDPYLRGRLSYNPTTGVISCSPPNAAHIRYNGNYNTTETNAYRLRAFVQLADGSYTGVSLGGANVHGY